MILESILLFSCLFIAWLFYTHYYKPYYVVKSSLGLSGPPPSLFYGNYSEIARLGYLECMSKWTSQYGPTFVYYIGIMPVVITTDLEIIKSVMVKGFDNFVNRVPAPVILLKKETEVLSLLRDNKWRKIRRIMVPMFTSKRLRMMTPLIEDCCERLRNQMVEVSDSNRSIETWEWFGPYTLGVILTTGFGRDISADNPLTKSAAHIAEQLSSSRGLDLRWMQTMLSHFPWCEPFINYLARRSPIAKSFDYLEKAALKLIEDRREVIATTGNTAQDLLQLALDAHDKNKEENSEAYLSNGEIVGIVFVIIMASYNSVRNLLSYTAYQLAVNQSIQDKLTKEIKEYYDANPDASLYDASENIEYVTMILYESMRLFSTAPEANRECNKTCAINGLVMQEGIGISIPFACLHLNPEYWLNPNTFDPERFREPSYPKFAYLPFGEGPRHCIGKRLALLILKMSLITMLKEFQFRKTTKTEVPLQLTTNVFSIPTNGIHLSIVTTPV